MTRACLILQPGGSSGLGTGSSGILITRILVENEHTMDKKEKHLARCVDFDFGIEDHGCPYLFGRFDYDDCGSQGFGYVIDTDFLMRFIRVFGVEQLRDVNGKSCWVVANSSKIYEVHPLHKEDGKPFIIEDWVKKFKKQK